MARRRRFIGRPISTAALTAGTATALWQVLHRTSPLVQRWTPSTLPQRDADSLSVRDSGPPSTPGDRPTLLLLHGLGATGDYFGGVYDSIAASRRVVVPDLLGFGASLDKNRTDFSLAAHLDALDRALDALELGNSKLVLAAHSMAAAIALSWAQRHPDRIDHVYLWGPPIFADTNRARAVGANFGLMSRLLLMDTAVAEWACRLNCANRDLSGRLMSLLAPRWPTAISRDASQHTWDAYQGSLRSLVLDIDWHELLPASAPFTIWRSTDDAIGDHDHITGLNGTRSVTLVAGAGHHVALQRPDLLIDAVDR